MEALLTKIEASPLIFDIIEAFGERTSISNESLGGVKLTRIGDMENGAYY
jgi:hypothetical protein